MWQFYNSVVRNKIQSFWKIVKAWPNARNISTQHPATLLHDVATCAARGGQMHATFSSFLTQHVNVHVPQAPVAQEVDLTRMP